MPDDRSRPDLRASDADRERVAVSLSGHAAAGRLDVDDLADRTDAAYAAINLSELRVLLEDLPDDSADDVDTPLPEEAHVRRGFQVHATTYTLVMVLLVAIWAITGAGYFWPVWPALGWGIGVAFDLMRTRGEIAEIRSATPDERPALAARSARRRELGHHHRHHHRGAGPCPSRPSGRVSDCFAEGRPAPCVLQVIVQRAGVLAARTTLSIRRRIVTPPGVTYGGPTAAGGGRGANRHLSVA